MNIMKMNKKGAIIGAVTGAVAGGVASATDLPFVETIVVACIAGVAVGAVIALILK